MDWISIPEPTLALIEVKVSLILSGNTVVSPSNSESRGSITWRSPIENPEKLSVKVLSTVIWNSLNGKAIFVGIPTVPPTPTVRICPWP